MVKLVRVCGCLGVPSADDSDIRIVYTEEDGEYFARHQMWDYRGKKWRTEGRMKVSKDIALDVE